jgi:integration host factor subunit alpha
MTTVTRADLTEAAYLRCGASRDNARDLVEQCLAMISDALVAGDRVGIRRFGSFNVRQKRERTGRNPQRPEEERLITARRVVRFRASREVLKEAVNRGAR